MQAEGEHDSNVQLRETDEQSISGGSLSPALKLGYRTPATSATLDTRLKSAFYDDSDFDSNDQFLTLDVNTKTPTQAFALQAGLNRDSTRSSELEDTGRITDEAVRREDYWLAPSWTFQVNARNAVQIGGNAHDVGYGSDRFSDYQSQQADVTWLHILSPRTTLKLQAYANRFEADDFLQTQADTTGLMAGGDFAVTENLKLSGLAGGAKVDTQYELPAGTPVGIDDESSDSLWVADTRLSYTQPRWSADVSLTSQTYPSGDGVVQTRQFGRVGYSFRFSELVTLRLSALYGQNESVDDRFALARDYADGDIALDWRLGREWFLTTRYHYRWQDYDRSPADADSNAVFLGIRWEPQARRWSR